MTEPAETPPDPEAGTRALRMAGGAAGLRLELRDADGGLLAQRPVADAELNTLLADADAALAGPVPDLARVGDRLYRWADGPEGWLAAVDAGPGPRVLRVEGMPSLRALPWELLRARGEFLCARGAEAIVPLRVSSPASRPGAPADRPLGMLFMACSPAGVEPVLRFEDEEAMILAATRPAAARVRVEESGTPDGLREAVASAAGEIDVLHLTGHADVIDGRPGFWMEDETGGPRFATAGDVSDALGGAWPRLVFLSGCRTGEDPAEGAEPSLCEALVAAGAPAVLGWSLPVGDDAASVAAAALYGRLAAGDTVPQAVAAARHQLWRERSPYWHLLRLYADATPAAPLVTSAAETERNRAGTAAAEEPGRFVGRRRAIQACLRVLRAPPGAPGHAGGVLLHGAQGLGKTALAARLGERMPGFRVLLLHGAPEEASLLEALGAAPDPAGGTLFERLLPPLREADPPLLVVLDGVEPGLRRTADGLPATDADGLAELAPASAEAVAALLAALADASPASRVIVTCRHRVRVPGGVELVALPLDGLRGADLEKKLATLPGFRRAEGEDRELHRLAVHGGAGNPRLLERVDAVLGTAEPGARERIDAEVAAARRESGLAPLLAAQEPAVRRFVALASVYTIPVDRAALAAVAGDVPATWIRRAVALGVMEEHTVPDGPRWSVSPLAAPAAADEVAPGEREAACAAAAYHLGAHTPIADHGHEAEWLEAHRLTMEGHLDGHARDVCAFLSSRWLGRARFHDIVELCQATLRRVDGAALRHRLGYALWMLGDTRAAQAHFERALALCAEPGEAVEGGRGSERMRAAVAADLATLVMQQGDPAEGVRRLRGALDALDPVRLPGARAVTLLHLGGFLSMTGELDQALACMHESLALGRRMGDESVVCGALHGMGRVLFLRGDVEGAERALEAALEIVERVGDTRIHPGLLVDLAKAWAAGGDPYRALELYGQARDIYLRHDTPQLLGAVLFEMAQLHERLGDPGGAEALFDASREAAERAGDQPGIAAALGASGVMHLHRGEPARALRQLEQAVELNTRLGLGPARSANLHQMAQAHRVLGDADRALALYQESLADDERMGHVQGVAATLHDLASLHAHRGEYGLARTLYARSIAVARDAGLRRAHAMGLVGLVALARRQGDAAGARQASLAAAAALAELDAWAELYAQLVFLSEADPERGTGYLAQALLLAGRVEGELNRVGAAALLGERLGWTSDAALELATCLAWMLVPHAARSPFDDQQADLALTMLARYGFERGVPVDGVQDWVRSHLRSTVRDAGAVESFLAGLVPPGGWLYDPGRLPERMPGPPGPGPAGG